MLRFICISIFSFFSSHRKYLRDCINIHHEIDFQRRDVSPCCSGFAFNLKSDVDFDAVHLAVPWPWVIILWFFLLIFVFSLSLHSRKRKNLRKKRTATEIKFCMYVCMCVSYTCLYSLLSCCFYFCFAGPCKVYLGHFSIKKKNCSTKRMHFFLSFVCLHACLVHHIISRPKNLPWFKLDACIFGCWSCLPIEASRLKPENSI